MTLHHTPGDGSLTEDGDSLDDVLQKLQNSRRSWRMCVCVSEGREAPTWSDTSHGQRHRGKNFHHFHKETQSLLVRIDTNAGQLGKQTLLCWEALKVPVMGLKFWCRYRCDAVKYACFASHRELGRLIRGALDTGRLSRWRPRPHEGMRRGCSATPDVAGQSFPMPT